MATNSVVAAGLLAVVLAGCDYVASVEPLGRRPLRAEPAEWAGTWLNDDGALTVRVVDPGRGHLEVGWIDAKPEGLVMESIEVHLRQFQGDRYASVTGLEEQEELDGYLWLRLERQGERLLLWLPSAASFRRLVEEGTLPGELRDDGVVLGKLADDQLALIGSDADGVLFEWREPMVLERVRGE